MSFFKKLFSKAETSSGEPAFTIADFREEVIQKLNAEAPDVITTKSETEISVFNVETQDGFAGQINLNNNYQNIVQHGGSKTEAVQSIFDTILVGVRPPPPVSKDDLYPLLRTPNYMGNATPEVQEKIGKPFLGELYEICMADLPTSLRGLLSDDLDTLKIDDPLAAARENMRNLLPQMFRDDSLEFAVLYSIEDHAHLGPSLVLFDEFWTQADKDFPQGCVIAIPRRDQLFLLDLADPNVVENARQLVQVTFADNFNLLTTELYLRKEGAFSVLPAD